MFLLYLHLVLQDLVYVLSLQVAAVSGAISNIIIVTQAQNADGDTVTVEQGFNFKVDIATTTLSTDSKWVASQNQHIAEGPANDNIFFYNDRTITANYSIRRGSKTHLAQDQLQLIMDYCYDWRRRIVGNCLTGTSTMSIQLQGDNISTVSSDLTVGELYSK